MRGSFESTAVICKDVQRMTVEGRIRPSGFGYETVIEVVIAGFRLGRYQSNRLDRIYWLRLKHNT
ncbi:hypothetical protein CHR62_11880 [Pusillimonas sp. NJUB218]|nr:hypothetical protein CHR62_11880 [Pusillimonas sp. NJUB218]